MLFVCMKLEYFSRLEWKNLLHKHIRYDFTIESFVCKIIDFYFHVLELDGEVLPGRTEYALFAIMGSTMKHVFTVVDWNLYDYYIVILLIESTIRNIYHDHES